MGTFWLQTRSALTLLVVDSGESQQQLPSTTQPLNSNFPFQTAGWSKAAILPYVTTSLGENSSKKQTDDDMLLVSHVRQRGAGSWTPRLKSLTKAGVIDLELVAPVRPLNATSFVGFVRITKTGSTSLLVFLSNQAPVTTFNNYLHFDQFTKRLARGTVLSTRGLLPACVFGERLMHDASPLPATTWQCPHTTYRKVVMTWARGLDYWKDSDTPVSASLQMFTIVRDPTERFVSYFNYWRQTYPHWMDLASQAEQERLIGGDLEGFLRLLSLHPSPTLNSAFQYQYLSKDVETAISMIKERPIHVLALVHECFDASLRLLADAFPFLISKDAAEDFLESSDFVAQSKPYVVAPPKSELKPVQDYNLADLKVKARSWFADDYRFYEAAVTHFRKLMDTSSLDHGVVQNCYRHLNST